MRALDGVDAVEAQLRELGQVRVFLKSYTDTHSHLHVALLNPRHRRVADVYLVDCSFYSGPTEGGPWVLTVSGTEGDVTLRSVGEGLVAKGGRISIDLSGSDMSWPRPEVSER